MRVTIPQPQFLKTLQTVEHAVNDRSTLPILSNVLIEITEQGLTLTATDLDVGIQCRFPLASPIEAGAVALPARKLTTVVRELPDDVITLESKKNYTATLNCGSSSFRIPGLPAEDFPVLPTADDGGGQAALPQAALKHLITQTAHAMSMEETRFVLNGALFATQKNDLVVVATDGRRLAIAKAPLSQTPKQPIHAVIPAKTIRELGRLVPDETEDVVLRPMKDSQLLFQFGAVTIVTRLIDGQFPQYEKVVPPPSKSTLTCDRLALINAVRRASLMTTATSQAVVFEVSASKLVVFKESSEHGSAREELPAAYTGEPMTVAFNPEFWLDALKTLDSSEVVVELAGPDRPAVIREPELTFLVLPMKVS